MRRRRCVSFCESAGGRCLPESVIPSSIYLDACTMKIGSSMVLGNRAEMGDWG